MVDFSKALKGSTSGGQEIARQANVSDAPFLSAKFWKEGFELVGTVMSAHKSENGPYVAVELISPEVIEFAGEGGELQEHEVIRIGNLAGIGLARREALSGQKNKYFAAGDVLKITCTGITAAKKEGHSDSPNFSILVVPSPLREAL